MILFYVSSILIALASMATPASTSLFDWSVDDIDGIPVPLSNYKGKVALVVNVASFCGYTKQYNPLETLYKTYASKGFVVLGFPANDFGAQEPGTNEEIKTFCGTKYNVTFDLFSKITVKGEYIHPLYAWLTSGGGNAAMAGDIGWNFEKFLVGKDGKILKRYKSNVDPMSEQVRNDVEAALAA